jgi:hypothetical protein
MPLSVGQLGVINFNDLEIARKVRALGGRVLSTADFAG